MILGKKRSNDLLLHLNGTKIEKNHEVVLLGVTTDEEINFKMHIATIYLVAKYK